MSGITNGTFPGCGKSTSNTHGEDELSWQDYDIMKYFDDNDLVYVTVKS